MLAIHLKKILAANAFATPKTGRKIILQEEKVMKVEVAKVPSHLTAVDLWQIGFLSGLKSGNWKKLCDYLLVFNNGYKDCAIFVELKSTLYEDKSEGMEQLRRSLPYLKYLHSVCRIQSCADLSEPIVRYTIVASRHSRRFDKQHVKPGGRLPTEKYKDITVDPIVRESINFHELWRQ